MLPAPGPIALRAVREAIDNIGVTEDGTSNSGKFVNKYLAAVGLGPGNPWCMGFVVFRLLDAAADLKLTVPAWFPRSGYTPTVANACKERGLWITVAQARGSSLVQVGDLCFFYMRVKGFWRIAHVGIVIEVTARGVWTVEGNTGKPTGEVQRDGGGVWRKFRTWDSLGSGGGFARLGF